MTLSFRARLTLRWTAAFGLVLALASLAIFAGTRAFLIRDLDAQLRTLGGTELASAIDEYYGGVHLHEFPAATVNYGELADKFVQLLDPDGRILMQSPVLGASAPLLDRGRLADALAGRAPIFTTTAVGRPGRMTAMTTSKDGRTYVIAVGLFTDPLHATLRRLAWLLAGVVAGGLAITGLLGFVLATRALRPIAHVTERAAAIARGDFSARLDPARVDDEIGRMTTLLNEMLERLHGALEANRRFAADASHELRSPLTAVLGEIDVALRRDRPAGEYRETLALVGRHIQELTDLADNLMILVRAQEGRTPPVTEVALGPLVEQSLGRLRPLAAERDVTLHAGPMDDVIVYGDARLLARVIDNLLTNAIAYNRSGGRVDVSARTENPPGDAWTSGTAIVEVRDTGIGIPEADRARVFERFYRADRSRSRRSGGAGLGLSIASEVVRLFGGSLRVAASSPEGTTIEIRLPGSRVSAAVVSAP
jgi:two-component system, OmpR family, sensor kinase